MIEFIVFFGLGIWWCVFSLLTRWHEWQSYLIWFLSSVFCVLTVSGRLSITGLCMLYVPQISINIEGLFYTSISFHHRVLSQIILTDRVIDRAVGCRLLTINKICVQGQGITLYLLLCRLGDARLELLPVECLFIHIQLFHDLVHLSCSSPLSPRCWHSSPILSCHYWYNSLLWECFKWPTDWLRQLHALFHSCRFFGYLFIRHFTPWLLIQRLFAIYASMSEDLTLLVTRFRIVR